MRETNENQREANEINEQLYTYKKKRERDK